MVQISNIVCSAELGIPVDLKKFARRATNVVYDAQKHNVVLWRQRNIGGHCFVYARGKLVCNGSVASKSEAVKRLRRYARKIQQMGYEVQFYKFKILTISLFHDCGRPLDLTALKGARYEPKLFPGAIISAGPVRFTCFHSGKVIISGVKKRSHLHRYVYPVLKRLL